MVAEHISNFRSLKQDDLINNLFYISLIVMLGI